jgi:hypothetical protein
MHKIAVVGDGNFPNSKGGGIGVAESVLFALDGFLEGVDGPVIEDLHWEDKARVVLKNQAVKIEGLIK